jgi:hypothetical protein
LDNQKKSIKSKLTLSDLKKSLKFRFENKFFFEQWFLIFNLEKNQNLNSLEQFKKIIPPKDRFWADPHIILKDEIFYIFFEEYIYENKRGNISLIKLDQNGNFLKPIIVLKENFHLSYPHVFEYDNQMYMIPETHEKKTIQAYRCIEFPEKWKLDKILLKNIDAVDSTILQYNNKWWLFTGIKNDIESDWNNLHIFYSDNPISENWTSHPMNPIKMNKRNSRSAGKIYLKDGVLYRPAQISTIDEYGKGIIINKIEVLNEMEYKEKEVQVIEPWNNEIKGIHTINFEKGLTVLDSKWNRRK